MDGVTEYNPNMPAEELIEMATKAFEIDIAFESETMESMLDDVAFESGKHWDGELKAQRGNDKRPCLTVPRANAFLNQVKNEQRQNKAGIKVSPRGASSQDIRKQRIKAAERRQGLIRGIQYDSNATDAYQCAFDNAVGPGRGFWQVKAEYVSNKSNQQKIAIDAIRDPENVTPDSNRKKFNYSDMNHCFYGSLIPKETFKVLFPDASDSNWLSKNTDQNWLTSDKVRVTELYCKWAIKKELIEFTSPDGQQIFTKYSDELSPDVKDNPLFKDNIRSKRTVRVPKIMWYKLTKFDILEKTEIPGEFIPIIPCLGSEKIIEGELVIKGMMRDLKDPARMYDFWNSYEAEVIAYAPKSRYIAAAGQVEEFKQYWESSNLQASVVLPYTPVSKEGHLAPPPQIIPYPEVPQAAIVAKQGCVDDMKAITGMHDPSLGMSRGNQSGKAILAEQVQGDNANYHFIDNLRIAITHTAVIINEWLDIYYPPGTVARILGEDESEKFVTIGERDPKSQEVMELGDPDVDIVVTMGAAYNTKRQQATESIMELVRAVPSITPLIYDIFVGNMDFPGAQAIADRLKKTIPPELLEQEGGEQEIAMKLQQAMQQAQQNQQVMQAMQQQIQEMSQELESKGMESRTKVKVAEINRDAKIATANIKALDDENARATQMSQFWWNTFNNSQQSSERMQ